MSSTTVPASSGKIVLITGASSGIGAATARRLAADGHHVVLGARRVDRLKTLADEIHAAGGSADHQELDVTSLESVRAFVEAAHQRHDRIDVMVNNAGVMLLSLMEKTLVDEWNQMIDVNLRGTLHGIAAVLPIMRAQGAGHIVNISSTAGVRAEPTAAVYCATKFAVRALAESLRQEVGDVRVTTVSPGFTESELTQHGADEEMRAAAHAAAQQLGIPASAIAAAISYAIAQQDEVDVSEIVVRPTAQR
ncbi:oxidoreductase [Sphaerisporangium melleum]|uniref:Oxidoreductase n=1 Tax=Sphaerisporangium melleum TaxID=321316 RepID=A0A917QUG4_9ACTN|nr:SDR family oxidoreductase [Sphaerisporangium melleum]GGK69454.1 oxidoreductase [Sphaerisporangium melleum]GII69019.1 oxidoreductase [Sphaerisporangium melleum]